MGKLCLFEIWNDKTHIIPYHSISQLILKTPQGLKDPLIALFLAQLVAPIVESCFYLRNSRKGVLCLNSCAQVHFEL